MNNQKPRKGLGRQWHRVGIVSVATAIAFAVCILMPLGLADQKMSDRVLAFIGLEITGLSILLTYWQAKGQSVQIDRAQEILEGQSVQIDRTQAILDQHTESLAGIRDIQSSLHDTAMSAKNSQALLKTSRKRGASAYTCVSPVQSDGRPMHLIASGDFYALHVLRSLIREDDLILTWVDRDGPPPPNEVRGNRIYLCHPSANPALAAIAPAIRESDGRVVFKKPFGGRAVPVWFGERQNRQGGVSVKCICYLDEDMEVLEWRESPSEQAYQVAREAFARRGGGSQSDIGMSRTSKHRDYGIVMRLSSSSGDNSPDEALSDVGPSRTLILAGIHQFGTLLAGEFFKQVCQGKYRGEEQYERVLFGEDDFAIVVYGIFDTETFHVLSCEVNDMWQHSEGKWIPIYRTVGGGARVRPSTGYEMLTAGSD